MVRQHKRRPERKTHRTDPYWRNSKEQKNVKKLHNGLIIRKLMEENKEEEGEVDINSCYCCFIMKREIQVVGTLDRACLQLSGACPCNNRSSYTRKEIVYSSTESN